MLLATGRLRPLARWCLGLAFWTAALFALAAIGRLHHPAIAKPTDPPPRMPPGSLVSWTVTRKPIER